MKEANEEYSRIKAENRKIMEIADENIKESLNPSPNRLKISK